MDRIWLPIAAFTISLFLVIILFTKKNIANKEVKVYKYMLILNLIFSCNVIIIYIIAKNSGNLFIVEMMQKFHFSLLITLASLFFGYTLIINNPKDKIYKALKIVFGIISLIFIVLIFITPLKIVNYNNVYDIGGTSYKILVSGMVIYFLLILILGTRFFLKNET